MGAAGAWQPLLDWWFGDALRACDVAAQRHGLWFGKSACEDMASDLRFGGQVRQALDGGLADWAGSAQGWLALLLLLDQLPRMIFRDTPRAYAGDARAQTLLHTGLAAGFERQLQPIERVFVYLVAEHAEDLALQDLAVRGFAELHEQASTEDAALFADFLDYARRHRAVVARFARFPHRNAVLGRVSSDEEVQFLKEPGSRF